jgi:hypothetical protein
LLDVFEVHGATLLRKGDCRDILESQPRVPDPAELAALVGDIERALSDGTLLERKAVMQAVVAEIRGPRSRSHPAGLRVPIWTTVRLAIVAEIATNSSAWSRERFLARADVAELFS